jgi:hypothetical protein
MTRMNRIRSLGSIDRERKMGMQRIRPSSKRPIFETETRMPHGERIISDYRERLGATGDYFFGDYFFEWIDACSKARRFISNPSMMA